MALDERAGHLYLAETLAGKVVRYKVDVASGKVSERAEFYDAKGAIDNIELDQNGRLWIALPLRSEIRVVDPANTKAASVFRVSTPEGEEITAQIEELIRQGKPWLDRFTPKVWDPAPGAITGVILSPNDGPVFVSGLGDALIRLER